MKSEVEFIIIIVYIGDSNLVGVLSSSQKINTFLPLEFEMKYFRKSKLLSQLEV